MTVLTRFRQLSSAVFVPHLEHAHGGAEDRSNRNGNQSDGSGVEGNGVSGNGAAQKNGQGAATGGVATLSSTLSDLARATIAGAEPARDLDHDELELDVVAVRLGSVAKVTFFFGVVSAIVWTVAVAAGWYTASSLGLTHSFQSFIRDIGFEGFKLDAKPVFLAVGLIGLSWIVTLVVVALVAAATYNLFASQFGGVRCVVTSRAPGSVLGLVHARDGSAAAQTNEPAHDGESVAT